MPRRPRRKLRRWAGFALTAMVGLAACGEQRPVRLGLAVPVGWYDAVVLAIEEAEPPVAVDIVFDTTRSVGETLAGYRYAEWIVSQNVDVVIGHDASRPSVAAATLYNAAGIPQLVPMATSSALEAQGPWTFALVPSDSVEGAFLAAFVDTALGARRVALLYNNDEFGVGIRDGVVPALEARGIAVVDERFFAPISQDGVSEADVETLTRAAVAHDPDVLIIGSRAPGTLAIARFLETQDVRIPLVCSDASWVLEPAERSTVYRLLRGAYVARFWAADRDARSARFAARFAARFGRAPDHAEAKTYDAAGLVLEAARAGARRPAVFRDYFVSLGRTTRPFEGLGGSYAFDRGRVREQGLDMGVVTDSGLVPYGAGAH